MPEGRDNLPERDERKKEEQGPILPKLVYLAPLFDLALRLLELILKIIGAVK